MAFIWMIILLFFGNWLFTQNLVDFPLAIFNNFQSLITFCLTLFLLGICAWIFGEGTD